MFIESFTLPIGRENEIIERVRFKLYGKTGELDNTYPCGIFGPMGLKTIRFGEITIFYGGNGSGKSTLLNIISDKLALNRISPHNSSPVFDAYCKSCKYKMSSDDEGFVHRIPDGSRIITSDDVFDYMLAVRTNNEQIDEDRQIVAKNYLGIKYGESVRMRSLDDYEALRDQVQARRKTVSRKKFITQLAGEDTALQSNGETALAYFEHQLKTEKLYCLDEPENSMSPKMQVELVKLLEESVRFFGCQLIIATHSPFLLAMNNTKIYDLDSCPVEVKDWWQLENPRTYFDFFYKHRNLFVDIDSKTASTVVTAAQTQKTAAHNSAKQKPLDEDDIEYIKVWADKHLRMMNKLAELNPTEEFWSMITQVFRKARSVSEYHNTVEHLSYLAESFDDYHDFIGEIENDYDVKMEMKASLEKEEVTQPLLISLNLYSLFSSKLYQVRNQNKPYIEYVTYIKERVNRMERDNKNKKHIQLVIIGILYAVQDKESVDQALKIAFPDYV